VARYESTWWSTRHSQVEAIFDTANTAIADCLVPMISRPGQSIDGKAVTVPPVRTGKSYAKCVLAKLVMLFYRREIEAISLVNIENQTHWSRAARQKAVEDLPRTPDDLTATGEEV
jgi:hypothetical protein